MFELMPLRGFSISESAHYIGKPGDLFVVKSSGSNTNIISGKLALVTEDTQKIVFSNFLMRIRPSPRIIWSPFLAYLLSFQLTRERIRRMVATTTYPNIDVPEYVSSELAIPSVGEQRAIANFLDRETARIDALVAKKERLIELLQEKRAALITRAVTKGLDPDVPMKDSSVKWLGEIPAHWEVKPVKWGLEYIEGPGIMAADFAIDGVPLLRIAGIGGRTATLNGCNYLSPELVARKWGHFRVRRGDLLISGSASTGLCSEVDELTKGAVPYTGIIIVRPRQHTIEKTFIRWFFLSGSFLTQTEVARSGSTIQHFGPSHLSRMFIVVPPLLEQCSIAAFLDRETTKLDALIAKVRDAIARLQELRTALISAAVTGKIDVRDQAA